jgi:hypothetical protein
MDDSEYLLCLLILVAIARLLPIAQAAPPGRKAAYRMPRTWAHISMTLPRSTISEGLR